MAEGHEEARELVASPRSEGEEIVISGIAAAPGIAIGPAYVYARASHEVEERPVAAEEIEQELRRFERAVAKSESDLKKIAAVASEKLGVENATIFEAQVMMLRDREVFHAVIDDIKNNGVNADYAVYKVMTRHRQLMKGSESEYLRERANDLLDLQDRLIRHLRRGKILSAIEANTIVIAESVTAADIVLFSRRGILGCAMEYGGPTSHVSIMARALDVPAVVSVHDLADRVESGEMVILDGIQGRLIIRPKESTLAKYQTLQERHHRLRKEQKQLSNLPSETLDHERVHLLANLEFREELSLLDEYGAEGIGLFRTEIMVLMQHRMTLSEEEQYRIYQQVVEATNPKPTVLRILDLGGDKILPMGNREANPFLGWRGIRVLLDKPDLLVPQLRAVLRASAHGPTHMLLPMVTNLSEIHRVKTMVEEAKRELREEGHAFQEDLPIGLMVEVPAVALLAKNFAREVDFMSIGTNDLTQYTLAVDRGNDLVSDKYQELHPAVLHLIKLAVEAADDAGIPISMCGELAGNARATPLLLGLGLRWFSASPVYLPEVKRVVRAIKRDAAEALAQQALSCRTHEEVRVLLDGWLKSHNLNLFSLSDVDYFTEGDA